MAARTFTTAGVNNLWSNAANWDGGVAIPADDDSVTIPSGQTCEYDYDNSAYANGIAGITVTGTLSLTRTAGTYYMKIKAATTIAGAGTFDCGTLASPIPFAAKHTITGGAGWYIKGDDGAGLTMTVYAAEPTIKTILLSGAEAAGQTELSVDTDVTGDIWADGDTIRIADVNVTLASGLDCEERVIAAGGIAAGTITATSGLTNAKITGAVISLMTRNVIFIGVGSSSYICQNFSSDKLTIAGGWWYGEYRIFNNCTATISAGAFGGGNAIWNTGTYTVTGGVFSGFTAAPSATFDISGGSFCGVFGIGVGIPDNCRISGGTFKGMPRPLYSTGAPYSIEIAGGTWYGNGYVASNSKLLIITGGTFENCGTYGFSSCNVKISNASLVNNGTDFSSCIVSAYNTAFGSTTENTNYTNFSRSVYSESIDHDQVAGAYKAWNKGGVTTKQSVVYPTGYTNAMQTVLENATVEGYWQKEVTVSAGASVNITMYLRKDASMTYLPRVIVFNKASADPFAGGAGLNTFTMTDSVDTWEDDLYTYTNSTSEDVTLVIRTLGMAATGNVFSVVDVEQINVDLTSVLASLALLTTTVIPDSYAADGDQPTLRQAVLAILQFLTEKSVSGTTVTVNKPDGATEAMTLTLDSATAPTSITRAS